jgi:hypothetical protein
MLSQDGFMNNTLESSLGITLAINLPNKQANNNSCMAQKLKELKAKVKTLERIA